MTYDEALKSVADIVSRHVGRVRRYRADWADDAEQFARLGVWKAWQRYRPNGGASFRTYAAWWVRAYVNRGFGWDHRYNQPRAVAERTAVSLDEPLWVDSEGDDAPSYGDTLPCPRPSPEVVAAQRERLAEVVRLLKRKRNKRRRVASLPQAEAVMRRVAGASLKELAEDYGVSRQRVDQVASQRLAEIRSEMEAA